jgi:hypothetical protein
MNAVQYSGFGTKDTERPLSTFLNVTHCSLVEVSSIPEKNVVSSCSKYSL